jgi:hypothetical protein
MRSLALLLLIASSATAAEPLTVSFTELVKHPRKYDGRHISVRAYALTSLYECNEFWASREAARRGHRSGDPHDRMAIGRVKRGYALPRWFAMRLFKVPPHTEGYDGYVHVVGTFRYIDLTHGWKVDVFARYSERVAGWLPSSGVAAAPHWSRSGDQVGHRP